MRVEFTKSAVKDIENLPEYISIKLQDWATAVEKHGIHEVRMAKGYHDEPLHGKRSGQRSIMLSRAYRAIYLERRNGSIELILVVEVNKHDY
jgi:proteic killer suppression protein